MLEESEQELVDKRIQTIVQILELKNKLNDAGKTPVLSYQQQKTLKFLKERSGGLKSLHAQLKQTLEKVSQRHCDHDLPHDMEDSQNSEDEAIEILKEGKESMIKSMNEDQKGIKAWLRVLNEMQDVLDQQDGFCGCCSSLNNKKDTYQ